MNDDQGTAGESGENLADEFARLGENIRGIFQAAWESSEGERFRKDITDGLGELGRSLEQLSEQMRESHAAQTIRDEMEEIAQRVKTGEVERTVRSGVGISSEEIKPGDRKTG